MGDQIWYLMARNVGRRPVFTAIVGKSTVTEVRYPRHAAQFEGEGYLYPLAPATLALVCLMLAEHAPDRECARTRASRKTIHDA